MALQEPNRKVPSCWGIAEGIGEANRRDSLRLVLEVSFRLCEAGDLRFLEWEGRFRADRRIIEATFRKQERGEARMIIAEINGMPVGQVWIDFARYRRERAGYIWAMRVVPWLQGLGIGTRLLARAESMCRQNGCTSARLLVDQANDKARKLYEREGFAVIGQVEDFEPYTTRAGRKVRLKCVRFLMEKKVSAAVKESVARDPSRCVREN